MSEHSKHVIIYSHGFGVEQSARGMFTDIAAAFPVAEHIMFDYNIPNREENTLTVRPLSEQKDILLAEITRAKEKTPDAIIDIIAHSQGCIVVALALPEGIRKAIFLAPPLEMSSTSLRRFAGRPGSVIDPDGLSRLARSDGSITLVPAEFWKEREAIDPVALLNTYSAHIELVLVRAKNDTVVSTSNFPTLSSHIQIISIDGDHDFRYASRPGLIEKIRNLLQ